MLLTKFEVVPIKIQENLPNASKVYRTTAPQKSRDIWGAVVRYRLDAFGKFFLNFYQINLKLCK